MFPISWNSLFRKKDGAIVKMEDAMSGGGGGYTLPTASADTKGGVKIGSGLSMDGEVLSVSGGGGGGSIEYRAGRRNRTHAPGAWDSLLVTFSSPMPDNNYILLISSTNYNNKFYCYDVEKTATGFSCKTAYAGESGENVITFDMNWIAIGAN